MAAKYSDLSFHLIKKGDKKSFELLFKQLYTPLVHYAHRLIGDQDESEGIVQQIFLSIWEKKEQLEIVGPVENYLYRATRYRCINYIKLELPKKKQLDPIEFANKIQSEESDSVMQDKELTQAIQNAIDSLPVKCKEIFLLSRYSGLTYQEIADELDLSIKTVENQMTIALKKLREQLKSYINK